MEKEIFINGRKIVYFEEGEGFPFLIIHGWGEFDATGPFLGFQKLLVQEGFKVFLPSLPGFIGSTAPLPNWKMEDYIECTLRFLKKVEVEDFYLLGHSGGGALAIHLAANYPEKVRALILCSPGIMGPGITPIRLFQLFIFYLFVYGSRIIKIILSPLLFVLKKLYRQVFDKYPRLEKLIKWLRMQEKFYFDDKMLKITMRIGKLEKTVSFLKQIKTPTLVIWGGSDLLNPLQVASDIGYLTDYTFKILPGVAHSPQKTCPEKLVELIVDFIKKLES